MTKDITARLERTRQYLETAGARVEELYLTVGSYSGSYDAVGILEVANKETAEGVSDRLCDDSARIDILRVSSASEFEALLADSR